jgi:hypothetical protein
MPSAPTLRRTTLRLRSRPHVGALALTVFPLRRSADAAGASRVAMSVGLRSRMPKAFAAGCPDHPHFFEVG